MNNPSKNLKLAEQGALLAIVTYILLSTTKLIAGSMLHSSSLTADGFNNISDIVANIAVLIGLRMARKPADMDHKFGHWKIEDLASLITSLIMFFVGLDVLFETVQKIISKQVTAIDPLGAIVGFISAIIMTGVYLFNKKLAKRANSKALEAAAKDNLSDAITSLGTSIAIIASALNYPLVDQLVAIIITFFILKTAYDIFMESSFSLSDGFDESLLQDYKQAILEIPKITQVKSQRGRTYGSNIYLDIILEMNPDLSVYESHEIADQVEEMLMERFGIFDIDIHIEPAPIPEDEILDNVYKKLLMREQLVDQGSQLDNLLSEEFFYISQDGRQLNKAEFQAEKSSEKKFKNFELISISHKTKLIRYQIDDVLHTSIWRRHENWQNIFHQETRKGD
ncbi:MULTISPECIES: cation diffusion facilitator family transporter [Streptococcus]|uniref:Cation diffusion facilitator family transporter n=1 Tax=Streptococcus gordonii TaxID=1302 RepID=A0AB34S9P7_STRGN|nr:MULTISPECIES: cation diffusion facilitator family transporter [Streptococcus]KJQ63423.1 cation efflux family protein [Streptococcus gordonii]MBZ2115482.1 cation diffusion facilitator family transporter [Streptococcus gordonii]MBZ2127893.1 cation diffusion facilitator family transporter [Streptococcus gordonii]MBZ2130221.1 cation diffusion facilitator family transporter [Streptococcus gordonii]MCY7147303.1 cation diffusion facilitator family transporter [Streptococcus gordonii]